MPTVPLPPVDFGKAAHDYALHRQGFPLEFFCRLEASGISFAGQHVLDLGTGTGLFARALADRGADVTGLDPSADLLAEANAVTGYQIRYLQGQAEDTGLATASFDLVTAATCWHWFQRDRAAREAHRLLRPDGTLLICHLDWWRGHSGTVDLTSRLIDQFNPDARAGITAGTFQYPAWLSDLRRSGFHHIDMFGFTAGLDYTHEGWVGRVRASAKVGPAMSGETLAAFEDALRAALRKLHPADAFDVEHIVFALVARKG